MVEQSHSRKRHYHAVLVASLDNEIVAFCGAFPDFAKKCGIKNDEFVAITQARAALDKFHKEHPEIKD